MWLQSYVATRLWSFVAPGGGVGLPSKRLMGMCRWMWSHFHDWIHYHGVAFSIELLEWGRTFSNSWLANVPECLCSG